MSERALRSDLPFRRPALVLSGGGALGAYGVGVLRVLESLGFKPSLIAGVSSGAMNAVVWVAQGFRTASLERTWSSLDAATLGMRWTTLAMRAIGLVIAALAALEAILTLAGSHELGVFRSLWRGHPRTSDFSSALLDALAWVVVGLTALAVALLSRRIESLLAHAATPTDPNRVHRVFGRVLLVLALVHLITWGFGLPWPHRFSATVLLLAAVAWFANRPGTRIQMRDLLLRLLPETGGRGLWGSSARRRLLRRLVGEGDPALLTAGRPHLVFDACALDTGRICHFINWRPEPGGFRERIDQRLEEILELDKPNDIIEAVVASSALPAVYEPVRIAGREFIDAGGFSNQPLHAALADGADAVLVVLLSPSRGPSRPERDIGLLDLGGRWLEIANWRDLQLELTTMPQGWSREAKDGFAARLCVVEPDEVLPGGVLGFGSKNAAELMRRGQKDAWIALERAGWLAPGMAPARAAASAPGMAPDSGATPAPPTSASASVRPPVA